jgi:acyl carrier protein
LDTLETVERLAAQQFGLDPGAIGPDTPVTDYGVDSLGLIEFLFLLEEAFNVRIGRDLNATPQTLRELAALMDSLRRMQGSAAGGGAA